MKVDKRFKLEKVTSKDEGGWAIGGVMTRTTQEDLFWYRDRINRILKDNGRNISLDIQWAYGRPRVYLLDVNGHIKKELSPRDRTGMIRLWLDAFLTGLGFGLED